MTRKRKKATPPPRAARAPSPTRSAKKSSKTRASKKPRAAGARRKAAEPAGAPRPAAPKKARRARAKEALDAALSLNEDALAAAGAALPVNSGSSPLSDEPDSEDSPDSLSSGADESDLASEEAPELGIGSRVIPPNVRFEPGPPDSEPPRSEPARRSDATMDVEAQIRALEARLDGLIRHAAQPSEEAVTPAPDDVEEPLPIAVAHISSPTAQVESTTADYVERQWGREALRSRFEAIDDFGLDLEFESKVRPALDLLYRRYFRVQVEGIDQVPGSGRAVIIANHGGTLPLDGAMLRTAMRLDHPSGRDLRWLSEDFVFYLPFAGVFLNRIGAVRACPENAERLLEQDALIAVFPEGVHGIKKLFSQRYRLQRFGRGGYIRLCLRARAPLVPCAIIGAEETNPLLYRFESLAELFKLPYLPVTPTFPLLGPAGLLPAPTRWKLKFGEPISFDNYGPEAADDHVLVGRLSERVRAAIQGLLDSGLRDRKSVWFG